MENVLTSTLLIQLLDATRWKPELVKLVFVNGPCNTWLFLQERNIKAVELDGAINLKVRYYW